ncbi:unnamed protein product [Rodentolepis nana]|uniref:Sister chromatid cohesion 1 protein 2 n=1 Tax=Rodentolepis nana TaxID=102285 RepID=A0A0R3TJ85_RODNA|nr:unnamed protein product [Rodentolepis nana]
MDELAKNISRLSLRQNPSESHEPLSIMSQANLLLTPLTGDIFTNDSILNDPFIEQYSTPVKTETTANILPEASCIDDFEEELPPGIVLCESTPLERNAPHASKAKDKPLSPSQLENYQKTPPHSQANLMDVYDNHIIDEELPMEKRGKRKKGPSNTSRFYQIHVSLIDMTTTLL